MDEQISNLEQEIEKKKKELELLKEKQRNDLLREAIKPLHEYTVEEKVKFFDSVYTSSLETLKQKKAGTLGPEIETEYDWEANIRKMKKFVSLMLFIVASRMIWRNFFRRKYSLYNFLY